MVLTAPYCKAILDTLPIGYYLGKPVDVKMSLTAETSACDMQSETIIISFPAIAASMEKTPETEDPEWQVRTHLYHEISHLILSPRDLFDIAERQCIKKSDLKPLRLFATHIMNIMEDERIETVMKHHFINVDFEKSLALENDSADKLATSDDPLARFFAAVRFHVCDNASALNAIKKVLTKYLTLHPNSNDEGKYALETLNVFLKYFYKATSQQEGQQKSTATNQENAKRNDQQNGGAPSVPQSSETEPETEPADVTANSTNSESANSEQPATFTLNPKKVQRLKEAFEAAIEEAAKQINIRNFVHGMADRLLTNPQVGQITTRMKKIIQAAMNRRAMHAPSSSAYSGRIDPRLTGNKDYRWFIKSNKGSDGNKFSKIKINLFVDCSGSFGSAMPKVNAIIKAFREVKDQIPEFDYDVIAMEVGEWQVPKSTLSLDALGCNHLDSHIHELYRQAQTPNARVANVVVFDGFAWTDIVWNYSDLPVEERKNAGAFNHPNCIVVTDVSNEQAFKEFAPQAKRIALTDGYVQVFTDKIFDSLERLLA